ncbi:MAG TPA: hypothetical protein DCQ84_02385 [Candidatus Competibacteraceae bacterium]|nr:hypothetical protein [Candidatus Competibacteraceae bacterium]
MSRALRACDNGVADSDTLLARREAPHNHANQADIGRKVRKASLFIGKPVIVLSALEPMDATSELARNANEKRKDIAHLYPGSKQVWVDSEHAIPLEKPETILFAIREVLPPRPSNTPQ